MEKIDILREHLKKGNVSAACDGSVSGLKLAHAWCLFRTDNGEILVQGCAPVDGIAENMTSTRTEIMGILAVTTFLEWFSKTYCKPTNPIEIYSDSKSAIQLAATKGIKSTKYAIYNDIDCVMELQCVLRRNPLFELYHVYGHQDETKTLEELDIPSRNNVRMDQAAGEYINEMTNKTANHDKAPILPSQKLCLMSRGRVVTSMIRETLIDNFAFPTRLQYLQKHMNITTKSIHLINWNTIARMLRRKGNKKGKYVKLMNNQLNTMKVNNRWNESTSDKCPLCDKYTEDSDHVFQCTFRTVERIRDEHVRKLTSTLKKLKTHETITKVIIEGITNWMGGKEIDIPTPSVNPFQMHLNQAIQAQSSIGWGNLLRGYIAAKWCDLQETHYKNIKSGKEFNRHRWENVLIGSLTKISKNIWKERCTIVKIEDDHTKDTRTREAAFLMSCELRKEAWKIPTANRGIIQKPKSFFYESIIDQILNWEQSVSKALKAATVLAYNTKSKITSWITRASTNNQNQRQEYTITNIVPPITTIPQISLFTYLTTTKKAQYKPTLEPIDEITMNEIFKPTGTDRLLRRYNKYRKTTGKYARNIIPITANTSKYIQFRIDRYINNNGNFPGPIN